MDRATYNAIRLKAFYWEKQLLRGREDAKAQQQYAFYSAELERARELLDAQKAEKLKLRQAEAAKKEEEWRRNVRRSTGPYQAYDSWTLKMIEKSLAEWKPSLEVVFD